MELYRGYVRTKNKKCIDKFKNIPDDKLLTLDQVKELPEYAGILAENTILIDIDDTKQSDIMLDIVKAEKLCCNVIQTTRGKHFLFKTNSIDKCYTNVMLGVGLTADIKTGYHNNSYEVLKADGKDRKLIYSAYTIQELPKFLYPVVYAKNLIKPYKQSSFLDMSAGSGRNQALFSYELMLGKAGLTVEDGKKAIRLLNQYVLKEALSEAELNSVMRDDAWKKSTKKLEVVTAGQLASMKLKPLKFIIDKLLTSGVTILSAKSKFYKSWLCLQMGISIASGEDFLNYHTVRSGVLYIDLENDLRITQQRLAKQLNGQKAPDNLYIVNDISPMSDGFEAELTDFLDNHNVSLVVIDIFQRIKLKKKQSQNDYDADYESITILKKIAEKYDIAIIIVSHNRKMVDDSDPFANMLGSTALMGATDESWVIYKKKRSDTDATISITGRTVESFDFIAYFNKDSCRWELRGLAEDIQAETNKMKYMLDPVVKIINIIAGDNKQRNCKQIIEAAEENGIKITLSGKQLADHIAKLEDDLKENDGISVKRILNGGGSKYYKFSKVNIY